jgi:hypothetical protein
MRNIKIFFGLFLRTLFMLILLTGCGIERLEIIENKCGQCHEASIVYEKKRSSGDWERVVFGMKARGLKITADEEKELMRVLNNSLSQE